MTNLWARARDLFRGSALSSALYAGQRSEPPLLASDLETRLQEASLPRAQFYFMLSLSVIIGTLGLLSNSAPTIIGAMIIAPLMAPIIGLSFGIISLNWPLIGRGTFTLITGVLLVIAVAVVSTSLVGLRVAGSEVLSRTSPTLLDLGVAIAAGAAAAFANSYRSILNTLAGVAIAVALVPPLTVTGIGLAQGAGPAVDVGSTLSSSVFTSDGKQIALGSFLLFATNLAGIVVAASLVFLWKGYGRWRTGIIGVAAVILSTGLLINPLGQSLYTLYVKSVMLSELAALREERADLFTGRGTLETVSAHYRGGVLHAKLTATAPRDMMDQMQRRLQVFRERLSHAIGEPVNIEASVIQLDVTEFRFGYESSTNSEAMTENAISADAE